MSFVPTPYSAANPGQNVAAAASALQGPRIDPRMLLLHQFVTQVPETPGQDVGHAQINHVMNIHNIASRLAHIVSSSRGPGGKVRASLNKLPMAHAPAPFNNPAWLIAHPHHESMSSLAAHQAQQVMAQRLAQAHMANDLEGGGPYQGPIQLIPNAPIGRPGYVPNPNFTY